MRLDVRVYIVRQGQVLFLQGRDHAGHDALQAPTRFDTDGVFFRDVAVRLVKEATGLNPTELYSCGTVFLRGPATVDRNMLTWLYRDTSSAPTESSDPSRRWLAVEPELSPEIPELDRLWLPFVLRKASFNATITFTADGHVSHHLVREKRTAALPP